MDVRFVSKQVGNTIIQCPELGPKHVIRFTRGTYSTANKAEIKRLLSDDYARRNTKLAPDQDLQKISDYLDSPDRPDVFTKRYLDSIPFELWEEILEKTTATNAKWPMVGIAKASLEGKPIDPVVEKLVEEYRGSAKPAEDETTEDTEDEITDDTEETIKSDDLSVREAVEFLKGKKYEEVENFISEGEERVSLLKNWNTSFPEHAVELP